MGIKWESGRWFDQENGRGRCPGHSFLNVMDDIADMSLEDALDYFGDLDIEDFL